MKKFKHTTTKLTRVSSPLYIFMNIVNVMNQCKSVEIVAQQKEVTYTVIIKNERKHHFITAEE